MGIGSGQQFSSEPTHSVSDSAHEISVWRKGRLAADQACARGHNLISPTSDVWFLEAFHLPLHYLPQRRVDARLISPSVLLEPRDDVGIQAQCNRLF